MKQDNYIFRALNDNWDKLKYVEFFSFTLDPETKNLRIKQLIEKYPYDSILIMKLQTGYYASKTRRSKK